MAEFPFNGHNIIDFQNAFKGVIIDYLRFNEKLFPVFTEAYSSYVKTILRTNDLVKGFSPEAEKILKSKMGNLFDERFREKDFITKLSDTVASYSEFFRSTGFGQICQNYSNFMSVWNNDIVEPITDKLWRTPSHKVGSLEKYSLFRYDRIPNSDDNNNSNNNPTTTILPAPKIPLLIVYGLINRHYILDLLPEVSIARSLLKQGFDVYATDWGTPSVYDKDLTIGHFVNSYMDKSVDLIREITKSDKVSLFGYCWGGILVPMYAALHPEKVKNVVTIATPGDFSVDNTLLNVWTKSIKVDALLDAFGNVPGMLLNAAFSLRNPVEQIYKYVRFFEQPHSMESAMEFFTTETWLYDSPPIIGEIYREFVKYCYQQNLFIKNQMKVDGSLVDLRSIKARFLNVIAQKDDLVAPASSIALNNVVGSKDKSIIKFPSGHVGLIIGQHAHKEVWPEVGSWLKDRS